MQQFAYLCKLSWGVLYNNIIPFLPVQDYSFYKKTGIFIVIQAVFQKILYHYLDILFRGDALSQCRFTVYIYLCKRLNPRRPWKYTVRWNPLFYRQISKRHSRRFSNSAGIFFIFMHGQIAPKRPPAKVPPIKKLPLMRQPFNPVSNLLISIFLLLPQLLHDLRVPRRKPFLLREAQWFSRLLPSYFGGYRSLKMSLPKRRRYSGLLLL